MLDVTTTRPLNDADASLDLFTHGADVLKRIALVGNFPPRRCGIATFTADMYRSLASANRALEIDVVALDDGRGPYAFDKAVSTIIRQNALDDYANTAAKLNAANVDLVCIQHEFGIFGGPAGSHLLTFLGALRAPVATTLHTVLEKPTDDQRRVMLALLQRSDRTIVMSERGRDMLIRIYGADPMRVDVIAHGAPDRPLDAPAEIKRRLDLAGRRVLMTFGLLSPNKGIESVIRAMPAIVKADPRALYLIVGATHPHLIAHAGESYRESLVALADELGVRDNVRFVNAYLDNNALLDYLAAADVYVTPYLNEAQITSGTLAYALAMGKPIVSTPYWHAADLLTDDIGMLVEFNDAEGFAASIAGLLSDEKRLNTIRRRAYAAGRETIWARSAEKYLDVFEDAVMHAMETPATAPPAPAQTPSLTALRRMSDDTGIYQHAIFAVPDRAHGYCIDDNCRALILVQKLRALGLDAPDLPRLETTYAAFVAHAWNGDTGRFRNFMSFDRRWLEEIGSEDSNGRAFWSLGELARGATGELRDWALMMLARTAPRLEELRSLRAQAFLILGADAGLHAAPHDTNLRTLIAACAERLNAALTRARRPKWNWFDPSLSYDNARLPQALIVAGARLGDTALTSTGLSVLEWLTRHHTSQLGHFQPVGNETFGRTHELPRVFDQQPLEATAAIDACLCAYAVTHETRWLDEARRAYAWFFGANDQMTKLAAADGGCFDGLSKGGVNRNQGAESILSLQLAHCAMALAGKGEASN